MFTETNNNQPWTKGKFVGQKLPFKLKEIWAIRVRLQVADKKRDSSAYDTHSLRRSKPTLIYKKTQNLRAVQLLLGHTKLESTARYLGIEVDDALEIAEQTEI